MERLRLVLFLATQSATEEWLSRMSFPTMGGPNVGDAELEDEGASVEGDVPCALRGRSRDAKDKREQNSVW